MTSRPRSGFLPWLLAGIAVLTALLVLGGYAYQGGTTAEKLASKTARIDLVERMQVALTSGAEAEKSAVLATTDADSLTFASQARAATKELAQEQEELGQMLATGGSGREAELFGEFSAALVDLRHVDEEILTLAVKNTNLKAYGLLFGPAAEALAEMDADLDRVATKYVDGADGKRALELASRARVGVLRIQVLLAPHIAEESDAKMDQMEASMTKEATEVRESLDGLAKLGKATGDADVTAAETAFLRYEGIRAKILPLSRENTNVRSLGLSLTRKRKAMTLCVDALRALRQALIDDPIPGVSPGRRPKPR